MGRDALNKVDWTLPGMEKFSNEDIAFFKRDIIKEDSSIVNSIDCLGWAYWPITNHGYLNARLLRKIADFTEIQNKPWEDEYDRYCSEQAELELLPDEDFSDFFLEETPIDST